jgi:hypothetical protein
MLKKLSSNLNIYFKLNIIAKALTNTEGNARINICTDCFLKMYQSELNAPSKINGGKNISKIPRGSIYEIVMIDSPTTPKLVAKYPNATLTMKSVGV